MDPVLEQLHVDQHERVSHAPSTRERTAEYVAGALFLVACAALWAFAPPSSSPAVLALAGLVLLYAACWQVTFEIGPATTTPLQVVFVPMWFVVDPALLPLAVAGGQVLGNVFASALARERHHWRRVFIGLPDAWYAMGPAMVLASFSVGEPTLADWPIYVLALGAQFAFDGVSAVLRTQAAVGVRPRDQVALIAWMWMVDAALAPIGLLAAVTMLLSPWTIVALIPLIGLLSQFAKERDERIVKAIELSHAYRGTAQLMGDVLEADDAYTGGEHTQGVVEFSLAVGQRLGLDPAAMRHLEFGALLHDIGKLRVPNEIINKPGKLDAAEWAIIQLHPEYGQEMLDRVGGALGDAGVIVRSHHERWDGGGYPDGLAGEEIPIEARIITVCDSFSAMTTNRSYRRGMSRPEAMVELDACSGSQFDPQVVEALKEVLLEFPEPLAVVKPATASAARDDARAAAA